MKIRMCEVDVIIFGGGIAGLWILNRLYSEGYNCVLIEKNEEIVDLCKDTDLYAPFVDALRKSRPQSQADPVKLLNIANVAIKQKGAKINKKGQFFAKNALFQQFPLFES